MKNADELLQEAHSQIIIQNERNTALWSGCKEDLKNTQSFLEMLPEQLSYNVMVPIGPRAMMRGKLVHTNELLVSVGDSYFIKSTAKQARDVCERKIKNCDDVIDGLQKELSLLENRLVIPDGNDAFGSTDRPEILEHVTEEEHDEWQRSHREKEKEYRQKLADVRDKEKSKIETEEDLWKRLDELELEEELEDELQRLCNEPGTDDEDGDGEDEDQQVKTDNLKSDDTEEIIFEKKRKRSVVFVDSEIFDINEPLRLHFVHSTEEPSQMKTDEIVSPSYIFLSHQRELTLRTPPSILKVKTNPNREKELACISGDEEEHIESEDSLKIIARGIELPEVSERRYFEVKTVASVEEQPKKISRFKAARMKKN